MAERESYGTFRCPLCGKDTPHHHTPQEQEELRGCWEAFGRIWLRNAPYYSHDDDEGRWQAFKSGWVAARRAAAPATV
jgi:hypothetical protein